MVGGGVVTTYLLLMSLCLQMFIVIPYTNEYPMYDFKVDTLLCPGVQCP